MMSETNTPPRNMLVGSTMKKMRVYGTAGTVPQRKSQAAKSSSVWKCLLYQNSGRLVGSSNARTNAAEPMVKKKPEKAMSDHSMSKSVVGSKSSCWGL